MFLRYTTREKGGKEHRHCAIVENLRCRDGKVIQRRRTESEADPKVLF